MVYIIVAALSIVLGFVFVGIAKLIDLSNRNKDWYVAIRKRIEEEQ